MVTGASTANLAIILVDARKGIIEPTPPFLYCLLIANTTYYCLCKKNGLSGWDEKYSIKR